MYRFKQVNTLPVTDNQSGRSMIEMLGVLAIIGVLSVGGIAGYSKAMAKYKLTRAQDQITMILMNVRTAYASSGDYSGLTTSSAASFNFVPNEMVVESGTGTSKTYSLNSAFGGQVKVSSCDTTSDVNCTTDYNNSRYFGIKMETLSNDACRSLASADWGADGLTSMLVNGTAKSVPLNLSDTGCGGEHNNDNEIIWIYH